ncbi:MAG: ABC transporter substrate-binding protein [Actinobacteria bacterium]|nr:ABC transporter substrate-binding protein [Actinomycetota bacterium]
MTMIPPPPASSAGKVLTAFVAGAMLGAFSMVEFAPRGVASAAGSGPGATVTGELPGDGETFELPSDVVEGAIGPGTEGGPLDIEALVGGSSTGGTSTGTAGTGGSAGSSSTGGTSGTGGGPSATSGGDGETGGTTTGGTSGGSSTGTSTGSSSSGSTGLDVSSGSSTTGSGSTTGSSGTGDASCGANNGGATDKGVTATEIKVAATVVNDGPGASLLKPATVGIQAVLNQVNAAGGICGRQIKFEPFNDSWDAARGQNAIRRFIEEGKFALLVVPSSEGLAAAIQAGLISKEGIPVVGTTGLRIDEYREPWVFPVASATLSVMRSMAKYAYDKDGARSLGIVWDSKFKFGIEGATAFKDYVKTLPGASVKADMPINPDQDTYNSEAAKFNGDCNNTSSSSDCDMVALLLVPETAIKWRNANSGTFSGRGKTTYGAQTLFTDAFASQCQSWCDKMRVWTGYNPSIPPVSNKAGVKKYVEDVRRVQPSVDFNNQFVEGAYLGTQVFVDAVKKCSPNLTRACLRQKLDAMDFQTDLANTLVWRPNQHHANKFAQAFQVEATGGSFNGWRYLDTGWIRDPSL